MIPGTFSAVALLTALVPGYLFLQLTRGRREARESDPVESLVELVAVGLGTTGLSFLAGCVFRSESLAHIAARLQSKSTTKWNAQLIQDIAGTIVFVLGGAVLIALFAALVMKVTIPNQYYPSAWKEVFAERRHEFTWIRLELNDGRAVVGPLHGSDFQVADGERDVVLRSPITEIDEGGTATQLDGIHRLVVPEGRIASIKVAFQPRPPQSKRRWWMRALRRR
jgi:hypothetical protein